MIQVTLNIKSAGQEKQHTLPEGGSVTLGRTDASTIAFENDHGLSRRHATFSLNGGKVFVADEGSTNGTFLNGMRVSTGGASLASGNEVRIGNDTTIRVLITDAVAEPVVEAAAQGVAPAQSQSTDSSLLKYLIPAILLVFVVLFVVGFILYKMSPNVESSTTGYQIDSTGNNSSDPQGTKASVEPSPAMTELPNTSPSAEPGKDVHIIESNPSTPPPIAADTPPPPAQRKLYKNMSEDEQKEFIKQRAQHIAIMMGKRPYAFTPEALVQIKFWLDAFTRRAGNNRTGLWGGDTIAILQRGRVQAPLIIHSFKEFGVPYVVGLYIPFIETEYNNISSNNAAGAAGLFQFLGPTAESYGVPAAERTNVAKMAPAAARYFRDNIMSFGDDSMSVALSIAGYNRAPESVKRDLRNVLNAPSNEDKERSFWTLIANQGKLDEFFQKENVNYVPRFFAAAIFGETPWAFGIDLRPLSTYTENTAPDPGQPPAD